MYNLQISYSIKKKVILLQELLEFEILVGFLGASAPTAVENVGLKYGSREGYLVNLFQCFFFPF